MAGLIEETGNIRANETHCAYCFDVLVHEFDQNHQISEPSFPNHEL
jgi:hypothetical protein